VISRLKEINPTWTDEIDHPMLLSQAARPGTREKVPQGLRLAEPLERIAEHRFDNLEEAKGESSVLSS